jgi:hypothetical protein
VYQTVSFGGGMKQVSKPTVLLTTTIIEYKVTESALGCAYGWRVSVAPEALRVCSVGNADLNERNAQMHTTCSSCAR